MAKCQCRVVVVNLLKRPFVNPSDSQSHRIDYDGYRDLKLLTDFSVRSSLLLLCFRVFWHIVDAQKVSLTSSSFSLVQLEWHFSKMLIQYVIV